MKTEDLFSARGWKNVTLVVWGPSAKLLVADTELQEHAIEIKEAGVWGIEILSRNLENEVRSYWKIA